MRGRWWEDSISQFSSRLLPIRLSHLQHRGADLGTQCFTCLSKPSRPESAFLSCLFLPGKVVGKDDFDMCFLPFPF